MRVICTDGTTFDCKGYELTEYGVIIYGKELDPDHERYAGDPEQTGYVPHDRLWYILPDGVEPNVQAAAATQGRPTQQSQLGNHQPVTGQSPTGQSSIGQSPTPHVRSVQPTGQQQPTAQQPPPGPQQPERR